MKILLTCILKDDTEYEIAERMLASFMPHVQGLAVALTGVSGENKRLKALIKRHKGVYVETNPQSHPQIYVKDGDTYIFANFAEARNTVFALADSMEGYDYYTWADVDDILVGGEQLVDVAEKCLQAKVDYAFFPYWYAIKLKPDGSFSETYVEIDHLRERLLRPKMFKWISRLHEVTVPKDENYKPQSTLYDFNPKEGRSCAWAHITDGSRVEAAMFRNIKILEMQAREQQNRDPRTIFYLAKTYYDLNKPEYNGLAEQLINDYLYGEFPSGWPEERSNAHEYLANIWIRRGQHHKAIDCLHNAIKEYPNRHMPYLLLAKEYAELGMHDESNFWLQMVLNMDEPQARTTIGNPLQIKYLAACLKYNEAIRKQDLDQAIFWLKTRNNIVGVEDDGMLKTLEESKLLNEAAKWLFNYAKWLKDTGHTDKIRPLLDAVAPEMKNESFVQYLANEVMEPKVWPDKSIVFYASWGGQHFEEWDEKSLSRGIGGSETAVIELSRRWAKLGYDVTVFAECDDHEAEGVHWRHWNKINWKDEFNILILWRSPHLLDREIKAKKLFMDLHDIASQLDWTDKRMDMITKVFFKSKFHRSMIPKLPDEKVAVISNGI